MSHHGSVNPDVLDALDAAFFGCVDPRELISKTNDASEVHTPAPVQVGKGRRKRPLTVKPIPSVTDEIGKALTEIVNHRRMGVITTEQAIEMAAEIEKGLRTANKLFAAGRAMKTAAAASDEHVASVASQWGSHSREGAEAVDAAKIAGAKRTAQAGVNATNRKPGIPVKTRKKTTGIEREVDQIVPKPSKIPSHLLAAGAGAGVGVAAGAAGAQALGKPKPQKKAVLAKSGSVQGGSKKEVRTGQALNLVAATGGAHALYLTGKDIAHTAKHGVKTGAHEAPAKLGRVGRAASKVKLLKPIVDNPTRSALAVGGAWGGLHTAELVGDAIAARALHRQSKVAKAADAADVEWRATISKVDTDKRLVFGWCSISKLDGKEVYDLQGDYVPIETTEDAAYRYMLHSRKGGDMHRRVTKHAFGVRDEPLHTADLVESIVVTQEKLDAWGLTQEQLPLGWWVGFKINDDAQWADVKAGKRPAFSIHGSGVRVPVEVPA